MVFRAVQRFASMTRPLVVLTNHSDGKKPLCSYDGELATSVAVSKRLAQVRAPLAFEPRSHTEGRHWHVDVGCEFRPMVYFFVNSDGKQCHPTEFNNERKAQ